MDNSCTKYFWLFDIYTVSGTRGRIVKVYTRSQTSLSYSGSHESVNLGKDKGKLMHGQNITKGRG